VSTPSRNCKNAKNPKPPRSYLIWCSIVHFYYMDFFFNLILYQTLGFKLITHFVGMYVGMDWKTIVETQTTINPLNEVISFNSWSHDPSCSPCWELSNDMSHIIWTQGNWVDYRLFVLGNQIVNLTPGPSFGHNLCFRCPNEQCEPISDIYVLRAFQWYKERLKP